MLTHVVPAVAYDEAVAFCNARLEEQGMEPITELPPGIPRDPKSCPCAVACGAFVELTFWKRKDETTPNEVGLPKMFITRFDKYALYVKNYNGKTPVLPIRGK